MRALAPPSAPPHIATDEEAEPSLPADAESMTRNTPARAPTCRRAATTLALPAYGFSGLRFSWLLAGRERVTHLRWLSFTAANSASWLSTRALPMIHTRDAHIRARHAPTGAGFSLDDRV